MKEDHQQRPAVFLDRDGTICEEVGYLARPDQVTLVPGSAQAIRRLNQAGVLAIVTTNQSGVARGYFTEEDVRACLPPWRELIDLAKSLEGLTRNAGMHAGGVVIAPSVAAASASASWWRRRCTRTTST